MWRVWRKRVLKVLAQHMPGNALRVRLWRACGFRIGREVYIAEGLIVVEILEDFTEKLVIGDRVAIAPRVTLITSSDANWSRLNEVLPPVRGRIVIEDDAWIGAGAIILPNVTVGEGAVVGAGAVVTRDVPPYTKVAGVPARPIGTVPPPKAARKAPPKDAPFIHPTADVASSASIGARTRIWHHAQVREHAQIGEECIIGKGVYIGAGVHIGPRVKVQNYALVYEGVTLEEGVFVGPHACLTNDRHPRAINPDGSLQGAEDWEILPIRVGRGASIGAHATVVAGVTIGEWAMVAAGAVVTRDVPPHALVMGVPARVVGFVCPCGHRLRVTAPGVGVCSVCGRIVTGLPKVEEASGANAPD